MADLTALDYEGINVHLQNIVAGAQGIVNTIKEASMRIDSFNDTSPIKDKTVAAVATKLSEINESLKDIPETLTDFSRSLKEKGESIESSVDEMLHGIGDI